MKRLLKRLATVLAIGVLGLVTPAFQPVEAQVNVQGVRVEPFNAEYVSHIVTAVDTDHALYIKYFGAGGASTTTVAVEAAGTGDLTFVVNGAAYAGFECPVSGALGGIIDVSNAACDTLGEVIDTINATASNFSTGYFRAVIAAGLRADSSNASFLADAADTEVTRPEGEIVFWDTSNLDDVTVGLFPREDGIAGWMSGSKLVSNPFANSESVLLYGHENITNAGTITNTEVHCVVEKYNDGKATSSETDTVIYLEAAAATTATGLVSEFNYSGGGLHCPNGKLLMRVLASGADTTAATLFVTGYRAPLNQ